MYEIWSLGHKPFEDISMNKVLIRVYSEANMELANPQA